MAKILFVEDDLSLASIVSDNLRAQGHLLEHSADGTEAREMLLISSYELLILDWDLPGMTGLELCRLYRERGGGSPVLILTAKTHIEEKESGLDSGADDYLTKPFEMRELSARIRALLRRPERLSDTTLIYGCLKLDTAAHRLFVNENEIELLPKEYALVEFFLKHPNQVFSLEALQQRIWPSTSEASPEAIRVHVARIRSKLQGVGNKPIIKTAFKTGYMFDTSSVE